MNLKSEEKELKFFVKDISSALPVIRKISKFQGVEYLKDIIYGCKENKKKIRLRLIDSFDKSSIEVTYKHRINSSDGVKTEIEEVLYEGTNKDKALSIIAQQGSFKKENSYEKIRIKYRKENVEISLDVYPYGVWIEIEGTAKDIWNTAHKLGYNKNDGVILNADELYLEWNKKMKLNELWHIKFGLPEDE